MKTTLKQMTPLEWLEYYKIKTQAIDERCATCHSVGWVFTGGGTFVGDFVACNMCGDEELLGEALREYESILEKERELKKEFESVK